MDPYTCSQVCVPPACRRDSRGLRSAESVSKAAGSPAASRLRSTNQPGRRSPAHWPGMSKPPASARALGAAARPAGSCSLQPASAKSREGLEPQLPGGPAAALTQTAAGDAATGPAMEPWPRKDGEGLLPREERGLHLGMSRRGRRARSRRTTWDPVVRGVRTAAASRTCHHAPGQGPSGVQPHGKGPGSSGVCGDTGAPGH